MRAAEDAVRNTQQQVDAAIAATHAALRTALQASADARSMEEAAAQKAVAEVDAALRASEAGVSQAVQHAMQIVSKP
ncbi:hypothetical protein GCM10009107_46680 [Ideonella azotifigens]|uniref:Lipoprotein n=2 Tax=Ideonella azotifigens TaxID=513160 RepID=A0ABP3VQ68_9BURK